MFSFTVPAQTKTYHLNIFIIFTNSQHVNTEADKENNSKDGILSIVPVFDPEGLCDLFLIIQKTSKPRIIKNPNGPKNHAGICEAIGINTNQSAPR